MDKFYCTFIVLCHFMSLTDCFFLHHLSESPNNTFFISDKWLSCLHAYTSIIGSNESRTDLHTHLTSTLPEGHNLWLDACPHAAHMVCSCNVYIPWVLCSYERGAPADSSNMPGQVCGWEISRLLPAFKVNLKCTRENKTDRERSKESLENVLK